jgi:shikimate dehydrogenase
MTDKYAVIGNPVEHSRSPWIHTQFAELTGQDIVYERLFASLVGFKSTVDRFFSDGGAGLNVTLPFKEQAWVLCDKRTAWADLAGAVNTLTYQNGHLVGHNTDGIGLIRDLIHNQDIILSSKRILILGAGGAVRGVIKPILDQMPERLVIANRTLSKAEHLISLFKTDVPLIASSYEALSTSFDLIINGTSASLGEQVPPVPVEVMSSLPICYDMMYASTETVFNRWAQQHGASKTLDGRGMLVEQAAESFLFWRGVRPDTSTVLQAFS